MSAPSTCKVYSHSHRNIFNLAWPVDSRPEVSFSQISPLSSFVKSVKSEGNYRATDSFEFPKETLFSILLFVLTRMLCVFTELEWKKNIWIFGNVSDFFIWIMKEMILSYCQIDNIKLLINLNLDRNWNKEIKAVM